MVPAPRARGQWHEGMHALPEIFWKVSVSVQSVVLASASREGGRTEQQKQMFGATEVFLESLWCCRGPDSLGHAGVVRLQMVAQACEDDGFWSGRFDCLALGVLALVSDSGYDGVSPSYWLPRLVLLFNPRRW